MLEPLEESYFNWLCAKVDRYDNPTPSLTHWHLLKVLHSTEFVWFLIGDDNRAKDGVDLRHRFLLEAGLTIEDDWTDAECSVLEMLIAFSQRAEFQTDYSARDWFWMLIGNLDLEDCDDASGYTGEDIEEILQSFIWRTYDTDGLGGLFPMQDPEHDQRKVEIWYQFCEYLVDREML